MTYLETHPPARSQYRRPRRATPSGAIVVHTAENAPDLDGPDGGAEGVAAFIARRTDPGSYHTVVDSDTIVRVVPYDAEAYGEGTGGNPYALHLSFACRTDTWDTMDPDRCSAMLRNGARAAADMARWLDKNHPGHATPSVRIGAGPYRRQQAGFISHAELDPGRRTDPGAAFPWGAFLDLYAQELHTVPTPPATRTDYARQIQEALIANGATTLVPDDKLGPATVAATKAVLTFLNAEVAKWGTAHNSALTELARQRRSAEDVVADLTHKREAAEAEAAQLRQQLQQGGRLPQLLADLDGASKDLDRAANAIAEAITKARA